MISSPHTAMASGPRNDNHFHTNYLKEFRTTQCPLFLQHKCTQHRPYTCFYYHFANQRRRRPRKDGQMFNYSPDIYCSVYDEATGVCKNGDDCPYLHRVAGDVERRYHLRYYKTAMCVYETDSRGYCVKNGAHCAYSHGSDDLRQPLFDSHTDPSSSSSQLSESTESMKVGSMDSGSGLGSPRPRSYSGSSVRSDKSSAFDDARWQDAAYVLLYYKTELCPKPARACRQGYACPYFHNARDRRRSPKTYKYRRSTPCPSVKHGDEWGDPTQCESGDTCQYCHSRTEQQFHPEIYKSTRCNDMLQTNQCPRGPFCAFAHYDQEICTARDLMNETPYVVSFSQQQQAVLRKQLLSIEQDPSLDANEKAKRKQYILQHRVLSAAAASPDVLTSSSSSFASVASGNQSHGLSSSEAAHTVTASASSTAAMNSHLDHLVGTSLNTLNMDDFDGTDLEREINQAAGRNAMRDGLVNHNAPGLDLFSQSSGRSGGASVGNRQGDLFDVPEHRSSQSNNGLSSLAPMRSPYLTTVQQHLPGRSGNEQPGSSRMASTIFSGFGGPNSGLGGFFGPDGDGGPESRDLPSARTRDTPRMPPGAPMNTAGGSSRSNSASSFHAAVSGSAESPGFARAIGSHRTGMSASIDPLPLPSPSQAATHSVNDQLSSANRRLNLWETSWNQAKSACEAWRREVEESTKRLRDNEEEMDKMKREKTKLELRCKELEAMASASGGDQAMVPMTTVCSGIHSLEPNSRLCELPLGTLEGHLDQLRTDQNRLLKVITDRKGSICMVCKDERRSIVCEPCLHCVMCERCSTRNTVCPYCGNSVESTICVFLPPAC